MRLSLRILAGALGAAALLGAVLLGLHPFSRKPPVVSGRISLADRDRRAVGVLHVHSRYSDGAGELSTIAGAARRAGLDFFVLTDHGHLDALTAEGEGYQEGVLRLIGAEISTEGGHFLALEIPDPAFRFGADPGEALRDVAELGGFSVVAHPFAGRSDFAWTGWDLHGFLGMEVFNFYSEWSRRSWPRLTLSALVYPFSPARALRPGLLWDGRSLKQWDRLLGERTVAAWAGLDAHGRISLVGNLDLPLPSYEEVFRMARNHLILREGLNGKLAHDRALVYEALRGGRGYVSLDGLADGSGFTFFAEQGDRRWPMGGWVPFDGELPSGLRIASLVEGPPGTRLRILRDGEPVVESNQQEVSLAVNRPGVYRAEAWLERSLVPGPGVGPRAEEGKRWGPGAEIEGALSRRAAAESAERQRRGWGPGAEIKGTQLWIASNPIYILETGEMWRRAEAGTDFPPLASSGGLSCEALGEERWPVEFHAEHDPSSWMKREAARSSSSSFRMAFRLGTPSEERPHVWCAVAERTPRDLSGLEAVAFKVKADRVYRVDFQLRDPNPRASVEGTEWWVVPFKTAPEWLEVVIPFQRLRSITPPSDKKLDLDRSQGFFFVLDQGNTRPGVSGWIEIGGLRFCRAASPPADLKSAH